ncbi:MAG TPA: adenylosuccinate lyase [Anaerolineales bacterium]|nr:adenylosuccinate lyase [Anaerolineales bacterium]
MTLHALSPLDGRYEKETAPLRVFFSGFAYLKIRARLELDYLTALSKIGICPPPNISLEEFTEEDAIYIQEYEKTTRHDVKAIEYYLRDKLPKELHQWLHFGLTSEDVNNTAQAIVLKDSRDQVMLPAMDKVISSLTDFAKQHRATPMLARTHGQPAVPTTLGKEIAVYLARLMKCRDEIADHKFEAKLTGAVGNFNALYAAFPYVDWLSFSKEFIESFGLKPNLVTTQILPYDNWVRYFDKIKLTNTIQIDFAQDMWRYISAGLLKQKVVESEVGSSTMPQKVNPIHFENAEGNLGIANALLAHYGGKLPVSRLQRDLSDSTVRRTFGMALGHSLLAWNNITKGMSRVDANEQKLKTELNAHWEVISEGAQTILRAAGKRDAYESLKSQTRGSQMDSGSYRRWIEALDVDEETRGRLMSLSPEKYLGVAIKITDDVIASAAKQSPTS